ncbi:MAG: phosphate--acyl-ACP acyltransferase, partial [Deltaproteobacteria bacterium]
GFVGNVTLKVAEGIAETLSYFLKHELSASWAGRVAYLLGRSCFTRFKKKIDYSEYGGAPLLGIDGIVIIGHGRSSAKAVMNAIHFAKKEVERNINQNILDTAKRTLTHIT